MRTYAHTHTHLPGHEPGADLKAAVSCTHPDDAHTHPHTHTHTHTRQGMSQEQTSKLLSRAPTLMMLSPPSVSSKLAAIADLLACPAQQASAVVSLCAFVCVCLYV